MPDPDPHLHAPARLELTSMLMAVSDAEFTTLRDRLEVSDSVLSKHLHALSEVEYVRLRTGLHERRSTTWVALTSRGRRALGAHVAALRALIADVP